jgi:hypothetical protein
MRATLRALALFGAASLACAAPSFGTPGPHAVPTFNSIGVYWAPAGGSESNGATLAFREVGKATWRQGLAPWFDPRNAEYRGSVVELEPGTAYEIRLSLESGFAQTLRTATWDESFRIKKTVQIAPGTTRLVIDASDSGDETHGYVVFTAPPGRGAIDQSGIPGDDARHSCVVVKQGVHHVIIRGLVLRNCKSYGVYIERQSEPLLDAQTHDIVIEDNEIAGWGAFERSKPGSGLADDDGAIHCNYYHERDDAKRPDRIVIQRNTLRDPRHGANPWRTGAQRRHPRGPQGVLFNHCGRNHVIRYNEIFSTNGNRFNDGIGGFGNFSLAGFPAADSDIHGNSISDVYDDAIQAEGANRNVRIWGNYFDRVFVAIANAATAVGPLYVWRNVSHRMAGMHQPDAHPDAEGRGPFIKAGSNHPLAVGGRAYYFHNTVLQPPGARYSMGAGWGITNSGGKLYNFVSRNNIWHIHKEAQISGEPKFGSLKADGSLGPIDADFDVRNGRLVNIGQHAERRGWGPGAAGVPIYATSGKSYPDLMAAPGNFTLSRGSPGYAAAEAIPNFNDRYPRPDVGAHQSGTPPMQFGHKRKGPARLTMEPAT